MVVGRGRTSRWGGPPWFTGVCLSFVILSKLSTLSYLLHTYYHKVQGTFTYPALSTQHNTTASYSTEVDKNEQRSKETMYHTTPSNDDICLYSQVQVVMIMKSIAILRKMHSSFQKKSVIYISKKLYSQCFQSFAIQCHEAIGNDQVHK